MIKTNGKEKELNHSSFEILDIINEAHEFATASVNHFLSLLDIDPKMYEHLSNIDIIVDYTSDVNYERELAHYVPSENVIHVCPEYVSDMLDFSKNHKRTAIVYNIANTLIHELIHANRDIFIYNGIHSLRIAETICEDPLKYDILCQKYASKIKGLRKKDVILYRTTLKGNYVLGYNNEFNTFDLYKMGGSISTSNSVIEDLYMIINSPILMRLYNVKLIKSYSQIEDYSACNISDFGYNSTKQLAELSEKEKSDILTDITIQNNVEEILTEAMSHIIMHASNKEIIDLDETYDFFVRTHIEKDIEIGLFLFKEFGIDFLKWYIVSCYEEVYQDRLKPLLKDKYTEVMNELSYVYNMQLEGDEILEDDIADIKSNILSLKK